MHWHCVHHLFLLGSKSDQHSTVCVQECTAQYNATQYSAVPNTILEWCIGHWTEVGDALASEVGDALASGAGSGWMHHTVASTGVTPESSQPPTLCRPSHWEAAATTEIWLPTLPSQVFKSHKVSTHKISPVQGGKSTPRLTPELLSPPIWVLHQTKWGHITPFTPLNLHQFGGNTTPKRGCKGRHAAIRPPYQW